MTETPIPAVFMSQAEQELFQRLERLERRAARTDITTMILGIVAILILLWG